MADRGTNGTARSVTILIACGLTGLTAVDAAAQTLQLTGTVYDFDPSHPDFAVNPEAGYGQHHGNVALGLDADGRPVYTGGGAWLVNPYRDALNRPMAPHLMNVCTLPLDGGDGGGDLAGFALMLDERLRVDDHSFVDSFDSNEGPYGDDNAGETAVISINGVEGDWAATVAGGSGIFGDVKVLSKHPEKVVGIWRRSFVTGSIDSLLEAVLLPETAMPPGDGGRLGNFMRKGGVTVLNSDLHCHRFKLDRGAVVLVQGDVTVACTSMRVRRGSEIRIEEGGTLTVYVHEGMRLRDDAMVNMDGADPQRLMVHVTGPADVEPKVRIEDGSSMAAWIEGAHAGLQVRGRSELHGSFRGREARIRDDSSFHVDMATAGSGEIEIVADCPGNGDSTGWVLGPSDGDVTSPETFGQWWRDVPGVNLSAPLSITMMRDSTNAWRFNTTAFFPIDGQLMGNDLGSRNRWFSYHIAAEFTYTAGARQFWEVDASNDMWVFLNGVLVLDIGGIGQLSKPAQYIDLDRYNLVDGQAYRVDLFYAQRRYTPLNPMDVRIRTNTFPVSIETPPSVSGGGD